MAVEPDDAGHDFDLMSRLAALRPHPQDLVPRKPVLTRRGRYRARGDPGEPYIPARLPTRIGADAVDNILGIIASRMLAVTTFSLDIMVSAYSAATSSVTPRATKLVMEDSTTRTCSRPSAGRSRSASSASSRGVWALWRQPRQLDGEIARADVEIPPGSGPLIS
jgi:hypothetical protein